MRFNKGLNLEETCRMSDTESESSLESINQFDSDLLPEAETQHVNTVREAVRNWKTRELDKTTKNTSNAKNLGSLREYVSNSSRLFYDLQDFLTTSKNKESNLKDALYMNIVSAIGAPASLGVHIKLLLNHFLERDLVELPYTLEPSLINTHAAKGIKADTEFPGQE